MEGHEQKRAKNLPSRYKCHFKSKLSITKFSLLIGKSYWPAHRVVKKIKDKVLLQGENVGQKPCKSSNQDYKKRVHLTFTPNS